MCYFALLWQFILILCINVQHHTESKSEDYTNITRNMRIVPFIHQTCRNTIYPRSNVKRFTVPDLLVNWSEKYADYLPVFYESPNIIGASWADPAIGKYLDRFGAYK